MSSMEEVTDNPCRHQSPENRCIRIRSVSPKRFIYHDINDMIKAITDNKQTQIGTSNTSVQRRRGRSQFRGPASSLENVGRKLDRLDISEAGAVRSPKRFYADEDSDRNDPRSTTP